MRASALNAPSRSGEWRVRLGGRQPDFDIDAMTRDMLDALGRSAPLVCSMACRMELACAESGLARPYLRRKGGGGG